MARGLLGVLMLGVLMLGVLMLGVLMMGAACESGRGRGDHELDCTDELDNDGDCLTDLEDPDCGLVAP